jgi:hypothetical protein
MLTKAAIVIFGTVIASAVTALPFASHEATRSTLSPPFAHPDDAPSTEKGDRLRVVGDGCDAESKAACADIYGVSNGPDRSLIYAGQIGVTTSVVIRIPIKVAGN